jgi:cell division protein FtsN
LTRRGKLGWTQRLGLAVAAVLILGLTFALGALMGRLWARHDPAPQLATAPAPDARPARPAGGGLASSSAGADRARPEQEKLTFYQTLTAPVGPVRGAPIPPERKPPSAAAARARSQGLPGPLPSRPGPEASEPARPARRPGGPEPPRAGTSPAGEPSAVARDGESASGPRWAVQVGAFRNREQADSVQRRLSGAGYQVSITPVTTADGLRYRVRVGSYPRRRDADEVAARVRSEGSFSTFVTPL